MVVVMLAGRQGGVIDGRGPNRGFWGAWSALSLIWVVIWVTWFLTFIQLLIYKQLYFSLNNKFLKRQIWDPQLHSKVVLDFPWWFSD